MSESHCPARDGSYSQMDPILLRLIDFIGMLRLSTQLGESRYLNAVST